ncbi:unnamed protein product, partial [Ixodes pacificus]
MLVSQTDSPSPGISLAWGSFPTSCVVTWTTSTWPPGSSLTSRLTVVDGAAPEICDSASQGIWVSGNFPCIGECLSSRVLPTWCLVTSTTSTSPPGTCFTSLLTRVDGSPSGAPDALAKSAILSPSTEGLSPSGSLPTSCFVTRTTSTRPPGVSFTSR